MFNVKFRDTNLVDYTVIIRGNYVKPFYLNKIPETNNQYNNVVFNH